MAHNVQDIVSAVVALDTAERTEQSALSTLTAARDAIADGIVTVAQYLTEEGAPSQRAVATALKASNVQGWSQPTLSRVVLVYRASVMLRAITDEETNREVILGVRTLARETFTGPAGKNGKPAKVDGTKVLGILLAQDDAQAGRGAFTSLHNLRRQCANVAQSGGVVQRADAGQARTETKGQTETPGQTTSPQGDEDTATGRDTGHVASVSEDTVTAMRGWTSRLQAIAATVVPGAWTDAESTAFLAAWHALREAGEAAEAAVVAASESAEVPAA